MSSTFLLSRSRLIFICILGLLFASLIGYFEGIAGANIPVWISSSAHIQSLDNQTVAQLDCSSSGVNGCVRYFRISKEPIYQIIIEQWQKWEQSTLAIATCEAYDIFRQSTRDFLNLSILSSKHHPPTAI